jgi:hypothetical protein
MRASPSILSRSFHLLLLAALFLPVLAGGVEDGCCPAKGQEIGTSCACDSPGAGEAGKPDDGDGGAHAKAFCDCGSCDVPTLVQAADGLPSPALSGTVGFRMTLAPPAVTIATLDRPPSA